MWELDTGDQKSEKRRTRSDDKNETMMNVDYCEPASVAEPSRAQGARFELWRKGDRGAHLIAMTLNRVRVGVLERWKAAVV